MKRIATKNAPAALGPYAQAVDAGSTVYCSGQLGLDPATGVLAEGVQAQTHQSLKNLQAVLAEAEKIAKKIMEKGPVAIQMAKLSINMGCNVDMNTGLMIERLSQTIALSTEDRKEGTLAFLEKRPAQFKGR